MEKFCGKCRNKQGRGNSCPGRLFFALLLLASGFVATAPVAAHFLLNVNIRIIHILQADNSLRMLVRLPMPFLVADKLGPETESGLPEPAPYTTNALENGELVHYLDVNSLRVASQGLGKILADGLVVKADGKILNMQVGRVRAYPANKQSPFALRREAESTIKGPIYDKSFKATYVGDTVVDVELVYPVSKAVTGLTIMSKLDPGLPKQEQIANIIIDHRAGGDPNIFRQRGLLSEPFIVSRSAIQAAWTFVLEGIYHILEGTDHLLFVFCLVLGTTTLSALAWRITGFSIGHTVTLCLGFFGLVPQASWFIPLVETTIAASIIYAAVVAIMAIEKRSATIVTLVIGLIHGLGFSFVLKEILEIDAPNLWQSLLAFNVGVEIGQLAIAILVWPILLFVSWKLPSLVGKMRITLALPCILIAGYWIGERSIQLIQTL